MLTFLKTKSKAVNKITLPDRIKGMFLAAAVGDALGVPYEFLDRSLMTRHPATRLTGGGTWNQPVGTWSDDTALSLCTASSLLKNGFNLSAMADLFVKWKNNQSEFTAGEKVFDIGNTTRKALDQFEKTHNLFTCGQDDDNSNGNGSIMRMPPVAVFLLYSPIRETYPITSEISAITHAHYYSTFSCFIYVEVLKSVFKEKGSKLERFKKAQTKILQFYHDHLIKKTSFEVFRTVLSTRIEKLDESQIKVQDLLLIH